MNTSQRRVSGASSHSTPVSRDMPTVIHHEAPQIQRSSTPQQSIDMPDIPTVWEHAISTLLNIPVTADEGVNIRHWVSYQELSTIDDFTNWDRDEFNPNLLSCQYPNRDTSSNVHMCSLKHNTIKQLAMLHKYVLYLT